MVMLISKERLTKIIKEELDQVLSERSNNIPVDLDEVNLYHDPDTGRFASKEDIGSGTIYSLTDKGRKSGGVHNKQLVKRGKVVNYSAGDAARTKVAATGDVGTDKPAGRKKMTKGDDITPKFKVGSYPQKYEETQMLDSEPEQELLSNEILSMNDNQLLKLINRVIAQLECS
jgi:hypothetical protein